MNSYKKTSEFIFIAFAVLLCTCFSNKTRAQVIYINEILASNSNVNADEAGEFDDWVELYNPGPNSIDVGGMHLTDDLMNLDKWQFPINQPGVTTIPANGYLLIWCDDDENQGPLHTSFKLSSTGEDVGLVASDGITIIDSYSYSVQSSNVSIGLSQDGQAPWVFFPEPTPLESNSAGVSSAVMPVASQVGGHYSNNFSVSLSTTTPNATIYYTTNGSEPTDDDDEYTNSIYINETTVLRAKAFVSGMEPSRTMTHTYMKNISHTLPIFCLSTDDDNFWGYDDGIYENWEDPIEQPIHIELYEADGTFGFRQDMGVQIHGKHSQSYDHKGLSFRARNEYGNNKINYQLFPEMPYDEYGSFILRASGNDWERMFCRDALSSSLIRDMSDIEGLIDVPPIDMQGYRPTVVYLNGEYFGIHNLREKLDYRFLKTHYDIDKEDADLVVNLDVVEQGEIDAWDEFFTFVEDSDFTQTDDLEELKTWIDIDHLMDYFLFNMFIDNNDWPSNNNRRWRLREPDQKWRFFVYDLDGSLGLKPLNENYNSGDWWSESIDYVLSGVESPDDHNKLYSTLLIRKLVENDEMRRKFILRKADMLNIMFTTERIHPRIDEFEAVLAPEIPQHTDFWWSDEDDWDEDFDIARLFTTHRDEEMWDQYAEYFDDVDDVVSLDMTAAPVDGGSIHLNTMHLFETQFPWSGNHFSGIDAPLHATANPGFIFTGWTPTSLGTDAVTTMHLTGDEDITANFILGSTTTSNIVINEINYHSPGFCDAGDWVELFNPNDFAVDVSGWFLEDEAANYFNIPNNTSIPAQSYLVLAEDMTKFQAVHPTVSNAIGSFGNSMFSDFGLSNSGEWISINNADRSFMDTVAYDDNLPWPEDADGLGPTLMLINPGLDNALPGSWIASPEDKGTPGSQNEGVLYLGSDLNLCEDTIITLDALYQPCFNCSYLWSTGATTSSIDIIPLAGNSNYSVTIYEGSNTIQTDTIAITMSEIFTLTGDQENLLCAGVNIGSIDLQVNGSGTYTYEWSNGATAQDINNLPPGVYIVTVSNTLSCTQTYQTSISTPTPLVLPHSYSDIICFGDLASIDVNPTGGTFPFTYQWSNGSTTQDIDNLVQGTYNLTVTDANNCIESIGFSFEEPLLLTGSFDIEHSCNGLNEGFVDVDMVGGVGDYFYEWSNGESGYGDDLFDLSPGTYTVTVTDEKGCTWTDDAIVQASTTMSSNFNVGNTLCPGDANGSINLVMNGGNAPYNYLWNTGSTNQTVNGLTAGTYYVSVTDLTGCIFDDSLSIFDPEPVDAAASLNPISCFGESTGSIEVVGQGGTGIYTYLWSTGSTNNVISNLAVGNYFLTLTDGNACSETFTYTMEQSAALNASLQSVDIDCNGAASGMILLDPSGGTAPFSYNWSDGSTGQDLENAPAGTYFVTITDDNDCTEVQSATILQNTSLVITPTATDLVCYEDGTGTIDIAVNGGTGPYSFAWENGEVSNAIDDLMAGTYAVTITDALDCAVVQTVTINQPTPILVNSITENLLCFGDDNGSITLLPSGGTGLYTFSWENGTTTDSLVNLTAGTYLTTITDNVGCSSLQSNTINQPDQIDIDLATTDVSCFGDDNGSIESVISGGTTPFEYLWSNGDDDDEIDDLLSGNYTLSISDANGCLQTETVTIDQPEVLQSVLDVSNIACNGAATGEVAVSVFGGTAPYEYDWSNGSMSSNPTDFTAGNYELTISDVNGCEKFEAVVIEEEVALDLTYQSVDILCNGDNSGIIDVEVAGGVAPYTYEWNTGSVVDSIGELIAGTYELSITDNNDCVFNNTFTISQPAALELEPEIETISCFDELDGSIQIEIVGGVEGYDILWSTGAITDEIEGLGSGTYGVTITDNNNCTIDASYTLDQSTEIVSSLTTENVDCFGENTGQIDVEVEGGIAPYDFNWSNGADVIDPGELEAGQYSVTISDDNGCTQVQTATIDEPELLSSTSAVSNNLCYGDSVGSIILSTVGGTSPYTYEWNTGAVADSIGELTAGTYDLSITDSNGCVFNNSFIISEPALLELESEIETISCFDELDGSIQIDIAGGVGGYDILWSTGATSDEIEGLGSGTYEVTVSDDNNCMISTSYTFVQPTEIVSSLSTEDVACFGENSGQINVEVEGGIVPYEFNWSNGTSGIDPGGLEAGQYSVTISDDNACTHVQTVTIDEPELLSNTSEVDNILCYGDNAGSIILSPIGGTSPYTYEWNTGAEENEIVDLPAGSYSYTITDANDCELTNSISVTESEAIEIVAQNQNVDCFNSSSGAIDLSVSGGGGAFSYLWSNGATTPSISNLAEGDYTVTITDAYDCSIVESINIEQPEILSVFSSINTVSCNGLSDASIELESSGGVAPYEYAWENGMEGSSIDGLEVGEYMVTVTDANNCEEIQSYVVTEPAILLGNFSVDSPLCNGDFSGAISSTILGGTSPYDYEWSNGSEEEDIDGIQAGEYSLTVVDVNGCSFTEDFVVTEPDTISLDWTTTTVICYGGANGAIDLNIEGGTADYFVSWSNGETTEDIDGLEAGTYGAVIIDANGCSTNLLNVEVGQNDSMIVVTEQNEPLACNGLFEGAITVSTSGGVGDYNYLWSNGGDSSTVITTVPGEYIVTVTDNEGCTTVAALEALTAEGLIIENTINDVSCFGELDANISILVSGGSDEYSYLWSTGDTIASTSQLGPGIYFVDVVDTEGCVGSDTFEITEPTILEVTETSVNPSPGNDDGSILITASGGVDPYTISWDNGASDFELNDLAAGTYIYTVTDDMGCTYSDTITLDLIIGVNSPIAHQVSIYPNPSMGEINIRSSIKEMDLIVYDLLGRVVYEYRKPDSRVVWTLDLDHVAAGVYFFQIRTGEGDLLRKVVLK